MGVLKLALIVLLVSVSVNGQEDPIVNEDEKIVSENAIDNAQDVVEEAPADILTENEPLLVRSGRYQIADDALPDGEPIDTEALNIGAIDGTPNERQLLQPPTTGVTNNEYGKHNILYWSP